MTYDTKSLLATLTAIDNVLQSRSMSNISVVDLVGDMSRLRSLAATLKDHAGVLGAIKTDRPEVFHVKRLQVILENNFTEDTPVQAVIGSWQSALGVLEGHVLGGTPGWFPEPTFEDFLKGDN